MSRQPSRVRDGAIAVIVCAVLGVVAGLALVWTFDHSTKMRPGPTVTVQPSASSILLRVLPYWQQQAPDWCAEDMACWIGSAADGRTPEEILASLMSDLRESSIAYAESGYTEPIGWADTGAEGDEIVANAYLWAPCSGTSGYPCRVADMTEPGVTDADGGQHHHCVIIATTAEDSVAVCDDGSEWPT